MTALTSNIPAERSRALLNSMAADYKQRGMPSNPLLIGVFDEGSVELLGRNFPAIGALVKLVNESGGGEAIALILDQQDETGQDIAAGFLLASGLSREQIEGIWQRQTAVTCMIICEPQVAAEPFKTWADYDLSQELGRLPAGHDKHILVTAGAISAYQAPGGHAQAA